MFFGWDNDILLSFESISMFKDILTPLYVEHYAKI